MQQQLCSESCIPDSSNGITTIFFTGMKCHFSCTNVTDISAIFPVAACDRNLQSAQKHAQSFHICSLQLLPTTWAQILLCEKCSTTPKNPISQPDTSNPKHMTQQQDSLVDYATLSTNASVQLRQCRQTQFPVLLQVTSLYTLGFSYMLQLPEPPKEKRLQTDILNQLPKYLSKNHTNVRCC